MAPAALAWEHASDSRTRHRSLCLDAIAKLRVARRLSALALIARSGSGSRVRSLPLDASANAPRGVSIAGPAVLREPVPQPKLYRPPAGSKVGSVRARPPDLEQDGRPLYR
jgi:hypothetical protein